MKQVFKNIVTPRLLPSQQQSKRYLQVFAPVASTPIFPSRVFLLYTKEHMSVLKWCGTKRRGCSMTLFFFLEQHLYNYPFSFSSEFRRAHAGGIYINFITLFNVKTQIVLLLPVEFLKHLKNTFLTTMIMNFGV